MHPDSLELLLDTICNTFGAVLFIAMLVVVLVKTQPTTGPIPDADDLISQIADSQLEILNAKERVRVLKQRASQRADLENKFSSAESVTLARELEQLTAVRARLTEEHADVAALLAASQRNNVELRDRLRQQRDALAQARLQAQELERRLKKTVETEARTARIPRLRKTTKTPVAFLLTGRHLYRVTRPVSTGTDFDNTDCMIVTQGNAEYVDPRPGGGLDLSGAVPRPKELTAKFSGIRADQHFVKVFVWANSFAEFASLKDALVEAGIEYEAVVMPREDDRVFFGESTQDSYVQ